LESNPNVYVITNDESFDLESNYDLGVGIAEKPVVGNNGIVIAFYGWPTIQIEEPEKPTDTIIEESFDEHSQFMRDEQGARCSSLRTDKSVDVLMCNYVEGGMRTMRYYIGNRKWTTSMSIYQGKYEPSGDDILDKIARNVVMKAKQ